MTAVGAKIAPANNNEPIKRCVRNMIISSNRKWIKSLATNNYVLTTLKCMSHSAHAPKDVRHRNHGSALRLAAMAACRKTQYATRNQGCAVIRGEANVENRGGLLLRLLLLLSPHQLRLVILF